MEELFQRFPHLTEGIYNSLDNQSLTNCRIVNNLWKNYLDQHKLFHIRKIKENITRFHDIGETWELIFRKAGIDILRKLFYAVRKSFKSCRSNKRHNYDCIWWYHWSRGEFDESVTPLHVAAAYGDYKFFNRMIDLSEIRQPKNEELEALLYAAAKEGNFRICRLLLRRLEEKNTTDDINVMGWKGFTDKNPKTDDFVQLLRDAAEKGNIQIFKVLIHTLEDRNPVVAVDDIDWSLLTVSAENGHWEICELIMKNIKGAENPRNVEYAYKIALLTAAKEGHVKVCKLFMDYFKDKIYEEVYFPTDGEYGCRAFSTALYHDNLEVCKLILEYFDANNPMIAQFVCSKFHDAAESGGYEIFELIVNASGVKNKNPVNDDGETPLHKAATGGHVKICKLILENVVDKCPIAGKGLTPLHCSARAGYSETSEMILQNIDKEEASIQCFKCYVCRKEPKTKPEFLAHYASDHEGVDPRGMTPYEYAVYKLRYYYESYGHTYTKNLYRTAEIFRKYLEIPETDPITGEMIFYLKYLEEPEAKKIKLSPEECFQECALEIESSVQNMLS